VGCNNESSAALFRNIAYLQDGTHPVTQNHLGQGTHPLSMKSLDVQGFSHKKGADFDAFHKANPAKPMLATECCSCLSQRGEDEDFCPHPRQCKSVPKGPECKVDCASGHYNTTKGTFYNNEISQCTAEQVEESDSRSFVAGTFLWRHRPFSPFIYLCADLREGFERETVCLTSPSLCDAVLPSSQRV